MKDQSDNYELRETRIASMEAELAALESERGEDMPPGWIRGHATTSWMLATDQFTLIIDRHGSAGLTLNAPQFDDVATSGGNFHKALSMELALSHYVNAVRETLGRNV